VSTKYKAQRKVNDKQIFVDEVETQLREKPLRTPSLYQEASVPACSVRTSQQHVRTPISS
jgi:hypothetical protein